jgi:hypothetical protein
MRVENPFDYNMGVRSLLQVFLFLIGLYNSCLYTSKQTNPLLESLYHYVCSHCKQICCCEVIRTAYARTAGIFIVANLITLEMYVRAVDIGKVNSTTDVTNTEYTYILFYFVQ